MHVLKTWGALALCLAACSGGDDGVSAAALRFAQEAAATPVDLQRLPALHQCLDDLSCKLKNAVAQDGLSLDCLVGSYQGLTARGDACALQIAPLLRRFDFTYGDHHAVIDWEVVAQTAEGRPVHNLETSDVDGSRPGVQLTRFTAMPEAVTETLALRAGLAKPGPQGLPQISYLRVQGGQVETVRCRFAG